MCDVSFIIVNCFYFAQGVVENVKKFNRFSKPNGLN